MTVNNFAKAVYDKYGTVTRARNCFLYTKKGIRLTDMFQEDGRAILGWHGDSAYTQMKNAMNRGVSGSFITEDCSRVEKAVSSLFASDRIVYYFNTKQEALKCALLFSETNTSVFKPWLSDSIDWSCVDCIVMAPPLPWTNTFYITSIKINLYKEKENLENQIQNRVKLPFPMEAGITRSIYNLIKALQERKETDWFIYDTILTKYWTRKGPYLFPKVPAEKYDDFVLHCLDCEITINPDYKSPSIIPFGADKGVFTKLKNSPFDF